ncbi:hypothetical protein [Paraburkholderia sp. J67]|nr:hypothetical protein [Paraburkholderia sp. J67]
MNFALLLSRLPHVDEARGHYDRMLALHERAPGHFALLWQRITHRFS